MTPSHRRILWWGALLTVVAFFVAGAVAPGLGKRIMIDTQAQRCLPWAVYWNTQARPAQWQVGDLVVFDTPKMQVIDPHDASHKLKVIAALPGQTVSVRDNRLWVNGKYWGRFWIAHWVAKVSPDTQAPWFQHGEPVNGTWTVPPGHVLLLGTEPFSFDARYWGWITLDQLGPRAIAL